MWAKCKSDLGMCAANVCNVCDASFSTKQELALHSFRTHGVQRDMRRYVDTEHCWFCWQYFHSRERLICHLEEKSIRCRTLYRMYCAPVQTPILSQGEAEARQQNSKPISQGWRRHKALMPVVRFFRPHSSHYRAGWHKSFYWLKGHASLTFSHSLLFAANSSFNCEPYIMKHRDIIDMNTYLLLFLLWLLGRKTGARCRR